MFNPENTEKEIMNLFALISAIKSSAENVERHIDGDTEDIDEHCETVINLSEMMKDKLSNVWKTVSEIESDKTPVSVNAESEVSKPLAVMIAELLAHSDIPDELFDSIVEGLDIVADKGRFKTLRKLESSPEYISKILSDYAEVSA